MASLDRTLRRDLENAVKRARRVAETAAHAALVSLGVGDGRAPTGADASLRKRLRAHGRQLGDTLDERKEAQSIERLKDECAYQHWHRLLFARFLAENELLVEPESGMALSLDECRELARERAKDWLVLASDFAQRMLPQIFRAGDPVLEVALAPEKRQELEAILEGLPREVFTADDSLGWVYQFWQADLKEAVNKSEGKIGADELPAVTQLFTEDYMVLFLLHNTLGAWWAGKVLGATPDLARSAASEDECRAACAVKGIEWSFLRFVREDGVWRPAAGTFSGWPTAAKDLTVLDPCMGSGHFLAFALPILVALRLEEEMLPADEAVDAVLRENLFGLELDPRCTQIAAFNVGLTAWKLAGYRPLPQLNLACSGLGINAPLMAWTALAAGNEANENAMKQLYELFRQAPTLGSLIDPTSVGGELFVAHFDKVRGLLSFALASEDSKDAELTVVAQGVARAASILAERYTLVATNVPYLGRGKQHPTLKEYCERRYPEASANLATCFVQRCLALCASAGTSAVVAPQNWLFLQSYKSLRTTLLKTLTFDAIARLGTKSFQTPMWDLNVMLVCITREPPRHEAAFCGLDAAGGRTAAEKSDLLLCGAPVFPRQHDQLVSPSAVISFGSILGETLLSAYATVHYGSKPGQTSRVVLCFWEVTASDKTRWRFMESTPTSRVGFTGKSWVCLSEAEILRQGITEFGTRGAEAWGGVGVVLSQMASLPCSLYVGEFFDNNTSVLVPNDSANLDALWAFVSSPDFPAAVRERNQKLDIDTGSMVAVPFEVDQWQEVARAQYSSGLPKPHSDDPTQWIFGGHPMGAIAPLQIAVARLIGYRWPRQQGASFMGSHPIGPDGLEAHADDDGIACLSSLRGEAPAAERVRALLADAFGAEWSAQKVNELLASVDFAGRSLNDWLRDGFFEQHCALFHQRPFVWQIWDGRKDGFCALVNYHRLAAPSGGARRTLEKLIYTYLGDWLDRQRADQKMGVEGADGRVAAAEHLKRELEKILAGEPPYDIFVRWKPLHQQAVGWEPDLNDGVRLNLRPFMTAKPLDAKGKTACILRTTPKNVKWDKDRGKEPTRERADYPWLWGWDQETQDFTGGSTFDGSRWNDLHYSRAVKLAARERAKADRP